MNLVKKKKKLFWFSFWRRDGVVWSRGFCQVNHFSHLTLKYEFQSWKEVRRNETLMLQWWQAMGNHTVTLYPVLEVEKQSWHETFVLPVMLVVSAAALLVIGQTVETAQK